MYYSVILILCYFKSSNLILIFVIARIRSNIACTLYKHLHTPKVRVKQKHPQWRAFLKGSKNFSFCPTLPSALCPPPSALQPGKNFPWLWPSPPSALRPPTLWLTWGQSYGARRAERGKVRGSFFQFGGRRAAADENGSFYFPLGMPPQWMLIVTFVTSKSTKCSQFYSTPTPFGTKFCKHFQTYLTFHKFTNVRETSFFLLVIPLIMGTEAWILPIYSCSWLQKVIINKRPMFKTISVKLVRQI